jgi:prepilin-type N-terminal cleavage/methylation domain-containing protein
MKKMNKKGFTLIEMLAVIAIIAVLVAIVIPTVSSATEKAKEAADVANIRSAVAEITTNALSGAESSKLTKTVKMTQGATGFKIEVTSIGGLNATQLAAIDDVITAADGTVGEVILTADPTGAITVKIGDATYGPTAE